jgi:hypothetical protein
MRARFKRLETETWQTSCAYAVRRSVAGQWKN